MVPNHTFIIGYIYYCHTNSTSVTYFEKFSWYYMEFIADLEITQFIQEILWKYIYVHRNDFKYMVKYGIFMYNLELFSKIWSHIINALIFLLYRNLQDYIVGLYLMTKTFCDAIF